MGGGAAGGIVGARALRARNGPRVLRALEDLYPHRSAPACELGRRNRDDTVIRHMRRRGYVCKIPTTYPAMYRLTPAGMHRALCARFRVGMLALCIMADAYVTHLSQREAGCAEQYVVCGMFDLLGGVYSEKSIRNASSEVCEAGHARRIRRGTLRLTGAAMRRLAGSHDIVAGLHGMLVGLPHRLDVESLGGPAGGAPAA